MEWACRHLTSVNIISKLFITCNLINNRGNCNDYCFPAKKCQVTSFLPFVHINSAHEKVKRMHSF